VTGAELRAKGDFVDVQTASIYLKVGEALVRRMIARGDLEAMRMGRLIRIRTSDLLSLGGS